MWEFYRGLVQETPKTLWSAFNRWISISALVPFVLALFNRAVGPWLMNSWQSISPWWSLLPIGALFLYGLMRVNYDRYRAVEGAYNRSISEQRVEIVRLQSALLEQEGRLSQKGSEILLAAYEGLKDGFGNILIIRGSGLNFVFAGRVRLIFPDPVETAEYLAEVESLVREDWIKCGSQENPEFYELTRKGLSKAKEIFAEGDGRSILAGLRTKIRSGESSPSTHI
jgi:hypothetical protein